MFTPTEPNPTQEEVDQVIEQLEQGMEAGGEGADGGPVGVLVMLDLDLLANDVNGGIQLYHAYHPSSGPSSGPGPNPNSGPNAAGRGNCNHCDEEWEQARETCRELLSRPHPPRGLTGGYDNIEDCARGFVSEECGGNPIDWGPR